MSVAIIILTLNEIDGVKSLLPSIQKEWADEIVIVDGGSTDGTIEECEKMGFEVVIQKNKGHGGAILTGVNHTKSDQIVIWSPDGNHEPEEIPKLIEKMKEGFDQVLISRFGKGSINEDAGYVDGFGNKMFAFITNVLFGGLWTDSLNESRIISRKAMMDLKFDALQMNSTQQMSIRGSKLNQRICEIVGNERTRIGGKRKMNSVPVGALLSKSIIKEFIFWK